MIPKDKAIIISVLILLIISSVIIYFFYKSQEIEKCRGLLESEYRGERGYSYPGANCFSDLAVKYNSPEICDEMKEERSLNICYKLTALGLDREDLCYKIISDPEQKITCLAAVTLDPEVCKKACDFVIELEGFSDCSISLTRVIEEMCYLTIENFS